MSREAFESAMRANGVEDFIRYQSDGDYISSLVQIAWMLWETRDDEVAALTARVDKLERALVLNEQQFLLADRLIAKLRARNKELREAINASSTCVQEALR